MRDIERHKMVISRLRSRGFRVEMDDFGSGTSSLSMLQSLHVDAIKLDLAFLSGVTDNTRGSRILKAVVDLARGMEVELVAEGVETNEHVRMLTNMGCSVFQGYYFSAPVSEEDFVRKYFG